MKKLYNVIDFINSEEIKNYLPSDWNEKSINEKMTFKRNFRAYFTGETRCPKKGEWFLSGAIIEAYKAPNNLTTPYKIAKLLLTETKVMEQVKIIQK